MTPTQSAAARRTSDRATSEARTRRFDDSLRAARRAAGQAAASSSENASAAVGRRKLADREAGILGPRHRPSHGEDRTESARGRSQPPEPTHPMPPAQTAPTAPPPEIATPELRALVRTLPVTVDAARVREGAPLALELGNALSVELRRRPDGLELLLRPDASLTRATTAELPAVVRALSARGLAVVRAEVRARGDAGSPARGFAR